MKVTKLLAALFLASVFIYSGCKKEDKKPKDYKASEDNANANNAFAGIWKEISTVTDSSNALRTPASACATATISPFDLTTWPKTVVIDFGTTNCAGSDYNLRRGKITAVFSGPYLDSNTVITVTLTDYYHNNYHVQGTQVITNKGHVLNGHLVYNVVVNNATVTSPDGSKTSTWNTNQDREFYAGENTNGIITDDVYMIRGYAHGIAQNGDGYSIIINNPLRVNIGCPWIVSGGLTLTLADYPTYPITVDYGSGTCDAAATAVLNGTTYNISMY